MSNLRDNIKQLTDFIDGIIVNHKDKMVKLEKTELAMINDIIDQLNTLKIIFMDLDKEDMHILKDHYKLLRNIRQNIERIIRKINVSKL